MAGRNTNSASTDDLMREAMELNGEAVPPKAKPKPKPEPQASSSSNRALTFLEYQEKAMFNVNYPTLVTPALGLTAAIGRISLIAGMVHSGRKLSPGEEQVLAKDLAQCLFYITAICDQVPVTLQKIAEISLEQLTNKVAKQLKDGQG